MTGDLGSCTLLTEHHAKPGDHIPSAAPSRLGQRGWRRGGLGRPARGGVTLRFVPGGGGGKAPEMQALPPCLGAVPPSPQPPNPQAPCLSRRSCL